MKIILLLSAFALLFTVTGATAQQASKISPITIDAKEFGDLMQYIERLPYSEAAPIVNFLQQKQQAALVSASPKLDPPAKEVPVPNASMPPTYDLMPPSDKPK